MHFANQSSRLLPRVVALGSAALLMCVSVGGSATGLRIGLASAWAQERPSVAVVGVHGSGAQDSALLRALSEDVANGFRVAASYDVVDAEGLESRFLPAQSQIVESVFLGPANDALREGRVQYESARFEAAVDAFRRAESSVAGHLQFVRDQRLLVDIQLFLGLSYASMGAKDDAREAFGEVVRLAPDRVLDSLEYPPKIVSLFDEAKATVLGSESAAVEVRAPKGTRVFVDGRRVGEGTVVVDDLPPGFHVVLAENPAIGRQFVELSVGAGQRRTVSIDLENVGLGDGEDGYEGKRSGVTRRLYEEIARVAGTDLVAVGAFDDDGNLALALYSARSDTWSEAVQASLKAAPAARSAFVKQLVERLALYADDSGAIKSERVSATVPALMLGGNPLLDDLLFGAPAAAEVAVAKPVPAESEPRVSKERKPVKPGAVIGVILGILGAGGAATGIYFAVRPQPEPFGTLQITIP